MNNINNNNQTDQHKLFYASVAAGSPGIHKKTI